LSPKTKIDSWANLPQRDRKLWSFLQKKSHFRKNLSEQIFYINCWFFIFVYVVDEKLLLSSISLKKFWRAGNFKQISMVKITGIFGSFFSMISSFHSRRWYLSCENNSWNHRNKSMFFKFNHIIYEIWLFIILGLVFGFFRAGSCSLVKPESNFRQPKLSDIFIKQFKGGISIQTLLKILLCQEDQKMSQILG
jgi:hypothetical protein